MHSHYDRDYTNHDRRRSTRHYILHWSTRQIAMLSNRALSRVSRQIRLLLLLYMENMYKDTTFNNRVMRNLLRGTTILSDFCRSIQLLAIISVAHNITYAVTRKSRASWYLYSCIMKELQIISTFAKLPKCDISCTRLLMPWLHVKWNYSKIVSGFQPSSTSGWNNVISARGDLVEIIAKFFQRLIAAHEYFQHVHCRWNNIEITAGLF